MEIELITPQFEALKENNPESAWELDNGETIYLLTQQQLYDLQKTAPDTVLTCIDGMEEKAKDCDDDIRFGYVAFGRKSK